MQVERREWTLVGGGTVSALVGGRGDPVVLLHGIPTGAELWRSVVGRLAGAGLRVLAPDLPGYGGTRVGEDGDPSLAGAAALLARWTREQELAPVWVVGHDAGGAVAQILAVSHAESVGRLTLVNSIADGSWPAPRARLARLLARAGLFRLGAALRIVPNPYLRREIRRGFADPRRAAEVDAAAVFWDTKFSDPGGRRAFERHLAALSALDTARVVPGLRRLRVPCQIVWGTEDVFQPWEGPGRRLQRLLPSPVVTRLEACGHFVPLECPERLVDALLTWHAGIAA